ncbi:MAG TPA: type II toxin-antitoxin system HicA family toxin [Firmicutes bacterium]|nr:type II toxin-antitoxin system HicA family toxin [Bacillota bacterium]
MKSYSSRELIRMLEGDGWYYVNSAGDHWHFKHPTKPDKITVTETTASRSFSPIGI